MEVHINLWESNICNKPKGFVFMDFGLMVSDIKHIDTICLYCPFHFELADAEDLGKRILEHQELVGAIFNETPQLCYGHPRRLIVTRELDENKKSSNCDCEERDSKFVVYRLDIENDFTVKNIDENGDKGGILQLSLKNILDGQYGADLDQLATYYFRFRIGVSINQMQLIFKNAKNISPFQNAFITTQVIDFRLNDLRSCNQLVRDEFAKGGHFSIYTVHYLLLRKTTDLFIHQGETVSSRLLEKNLWENYIGGLTDNVIAYHFKKKIFLSKEKNGIKDYSVLTRFEYERLDIKVMLLYTCIVLYLGLLSSALFYFLQKSYPLDIPYILAIILGGITFFVWLFLLRKSE